MMTVKEIHQLNNNLLAALVAANSQDTVLGQLARKEESRRARRRQHRDARQAA